MKKQFRIIDSRLGNIESLLSDLRDAAALNGTPSFCRNADRGFLHSASQLACFLQCDPKTARKLLRYGIIRSTRTGSSLSVYIPDILEAAQNDDRVGKFIRRILSGSAERKALQKLKKESLPPRIYVETELYPGRFVFATIKYQGWRCTACFPYLLWNQPEKVEDFVNEIIRSRHEKVPFRIPPAA